MKISVIGAGNVGATVVNSIANQKYAHEIVLLDIKDGLAEGKGLDIWQSAPVAGFSTRVYGVTNDYGATKNSNIVVITSGLPRRPGMSRDDLISKNAKIVKSVTEKVVEHSPDAIIVVVSNPLDVMVYTAVLASKKNPSQVFGMAGILDTARYRAFIAEELYVSPQSVKALLLGGHGDTMVPLPRFTTVGGIPVTELIDQEKLDKIIDRTRKGGGELVGLMGTSAWYAPGAAAAQMVESIALNQNLIVPLSTKLNGEFGLENVFIGVPAILGRFGIKEIIEINLNDEELQFLQNSGMAVKELMNRLDEMEIF